MTITSLTYEYMTAYHQLVNPPYNYSNLSGSRCCRPQDTTRFQDRHGPSPYLHRSGL